MRNFKRLLAIVLVILNILAMAACSKRIKKISGEEFALRLRDHSFVVNQSDTSADGLLSSYVAYPEENSKSVTVTYSEFESEDDARMCFNTTKHSFERAKHAGDYTEITIGNQKFTAKNGTDYIAIVIFAENTLIMASGTSEVQVKDAIKYLGY